MINPISIVDFYKEKNIFITGATGFLGKVLLEKLLRSCPNIERIYILMRSKDDQSVSTRVKNLLNTKIFRHLHSTSPQVFDKVVGIAGDILLPNLGISLSDKELLINHVAVVFHGAASIKFNDTLKFATLMNVSGTQKVLEFSKKMRKLKAFVYISTAFSFCNRRDIGEKIYPVSLEPSKLLTLTDWMDEAVLETIVDRIVGDWVTTYHLTKSLAEKILEKESQLLPITIVRPSVVIGAWKEPLIGYTETMYHMNGILVGAGRGVLRVLHCNPDAIVDIIPVDVVTNMLIAAAWSRGIERSNEGLTVLNCVTGIDRPLTYREFRDYSLPALRNQPILYPVWYPYLTLMKYKFMAIFLMFFLHTVPAFFLDCALRLVGMEPRLGKIVKKIERSQRSSEFFLNTEFTFSNNNVKELWKKVPLQERDTFNFDISDLQWKEYLEGYYLGVKQFVVKEDLSTLRKAKSQMKRMKLVYYFLSGLFIIPLVLWPVYAFSCKFTINNKFLFY